MEENQMSGSESNELYNLNKSGLNEVNADSTSETR